MDFKPMVKNVIINQDKPFYASDILRALHNIGFYDDHMIIETINELFEERAIIYDKVLEEKDGNFGFAYVSTKINENSESRTRKLK